MDWTCHGMSVSPLLANFYIMKIQWFIIVMSFPGLQNFAQEPIDAWSQALGQAGTMLGETVTAFASPASMASVKKPCFTAYAENQWGIPELSTGAFSVILPVKNNALAFGYASSGYEAFSESHFRLCAAHGFGTAARAGISIEYARVRQYDGYGNLHALTPAISLQIMPASFFVLGIQLSNPLKTGYFPEGYKSIPAKIAAGIGFSPDKDVLICMEWKKESDSKPVYCGGIELAFGKYFRLRTGVSSSSTLQYGIGIGMHAGHVNIDLSAVHHPILGYSPALTLIYSIG
jgi:hypothetical protein